MADIQSATTEIRRGKKKEEEDRRNHRAKNIMAGPISQGGHKKQDKNIMSASATQGGHN